MNRTKIEWTDYTLNPIKGICKMSCDYCYAKKIYKRFKLSPRVSLRIKEFNKLKSLRVSSKIFLCSTHELFGNWIPDAWREMIFKEIAKYPQHTFQILTKCPNKATEWFLPDNVWLGVTIDNWVGTRLIALRNSHAKLKFVSFEPLLDEIDTDLEGINWVIIGAQTAPYNPPEREWVEKIIKEARRHKIPVFLKNNLKWKKKIQEFPKVKL